MVKQNFFGFFRSNNKPKIFNPRDSQLIPGIMCGHNFINDIFANSNEVIFLIDGEESCLYL